jgi:hypothetical protein
MPTGSGGNADTCEHQHQQASRPPFLAASFFWCKFLGCKFFVLGVFRVARLMCCKTFALKNSQASSRTNEASCINWAATLTRQAALTRVDAVVDSVGNGLGIVGETFNQFDNFGPLLGRKFHEGSKQSQTFDCLVRWRSKLLSQIRNKCATSHLAPLTVDQVESMPRNNSAGKINRSAE